VTVSFLTMLHAFLSFLSVKVVDPRDKIKKDYCSRKGIPLCLIRFNPNPEKQRMPQILNAFIEELKSRLLRYLYLQSIFLLW
jgi:hypothetical protein